MLSIKNLLRAFFTFIFIFSFKLAHADGSDILIQILDTEVLNQLENSGYSLGEMLSGKKAESKTSELFKSNSLYRSFALTIGQPLLHDSKTDQLPVSIEKNQGDIPELVRLIRNFEDKGKRSEKDSKSGYYIRHLSNNSQYPYSVEYDGDEPRHFDYRWLNSEFGFFKLIAVSNRMDRVDFNPESCGEVRFIYRLSYHSPKSSSSLPFFVTIVRQYPKKPNCSEFAKNWIFAQKDILQSRALKQLTFKQLEINFQSLRFTSGYMHDFGGQAMYMLRIFRNIDGTLAPVSLENTPDVLRIQKDPKLLNQFVEFLKKGDNLIKLDQGTLLIDFNDDFLAKLAVSWSTLGRVRTANKPYTAIFQDQKKLLDSIDLKNLKFIKTHDALLERLNNLTCMGCHQSGGTAGFHMLGMADDNFSHGFNRQELPQSPHAFADSIRRLAYVKAIAENKSPNKFRPLSNFPSANWQGTNEIPKFESLGTGQLCLLDQKNFSATPQCMPETKCIEVVGSESKKVLFGECVKENSPLAGSACWSGPVTENLKLPTDRGAIPTFNFFAFQDKWKLANPLKQNPKYKCVLPQSGAPLGRSSRACTQAEENFSEIKFAKNNFPSEICGNQGGNGFDLCAATGDSGACLESRVVRSMLDTCYPSHFCREDYICQKLPDYSQISEAYYSTKKNGKKVNQSTPDQINAANIKLAQNQHVGFCVPTYFLFNMRLDGHPSPVTGLPPGDPKVDRSQPVRGYK